MGVLHKKLFRDLRQSWSQAVAVALVVMCGVATYIAIGSAYRNLLLTRDTYYEAYRLADFEIMVERAPRTAAFKLEALDGVRHVRGRIVQDVNVDIADLAEARTGRIVSMPERDENVLDDIHLMSGRYFAPGQYNEVIVSKRFAEANGLALNDILRVSIDGKKHPLKVVGTALSPEYVYLIRNVQELVPSPERFGILWVPEEFAETALDMREACNNFVGAVDDDTRLDALLDKAEDVLEPYGVYAKVKKEDQISNRFLSDEITGLGVSARITPTIFLSVAAMILLVLLSRMVRKERTEIGLLKAYGYSDWAVSAHYLRFALVLAGAGCLAGFVVGQWLANAMIRLYVQFYEFPILRARIYPEVLARSMGIALLSALAGAWLAARRAARVHPAESMRPEAPSFAARTPLERIPYLWSRLTFISKIIARNIARTPIRAAFNVFGVMVSVGLLIMGFFSSNAMDFIIDFQFHTVQREDATVSLVTEFGKDAFYEFQRFDEVDYAEPLLLYPFRVTSAWREKDISVTGIPRDGRLQRPTDISRRSVDVGDGGLILTSRLAEELGVAPGDRVRLKPLMGRVETERDVTIRAVTEQYLGNSAYMNLDALSRLLDEPFAMNAVLVRTSPEGAAALNERLKDVATVAAVAIKKDMLRSLQETLAASMNIMNTMMVFFAGTIAFAIIYNVTMVSLAERERELASLRVLGFSRREVGSILYRENAVLGLAGALLGVPFGIAICGLMVYAYNTDLYRFPFHIEPSSCVIAAGLALFFVGLANLAVHRRIAKLDMVEVLKSRE